MRLANAAFLPSRVWKDTSVWTASTTSRRTLQVHGRLAGGRYQLDATAAAPFPSELAESRHLIHLTRLSDDSDYAWDTEVPYAVGTVRASDVGAFVGALFSSAEGRDETRVRADYRLVIPRASAVLGELFRVDSIRTTHLADGSTLAQFAVTMAPERLEQRYPNFAKYLRRYAQTARMRFALRDSAGVYFESSMAKGLMELRVRSLNGGLVALAGSPRPIPDSLTLTGEFTMKVKGFTVGFRNYHAEFTTLRTEHERAWNLVSRREPDWVLPLITEHLIRSPLRRPFQGSGASFRISVRDSADAQTILNRRLHLEVKESAILRFLGKLGAVAVNEYTGKVEREEAAWLRRFFDALVADIRLLGAGSDEGMP